MFPGPDRAAHVLVLGAELHAADVADPDHPAVAGGPDDDLLELVGVDEPAERAQGDLGLLPWEDRRLPDLAGGDLKVLLAQGPHDVAGGHASLGELVGVEPDPHAVIALAEHQDVADAGQPRDLVADPHEGVIAQVELVVAAVRASRARSTAGCRGTASWWSRRWP